MATFIKLLFAFTPQVISVQDKKLFFVLRFWAKKLAVRSCPVGTPAKPLSLIKPPSQSIAISVVPTKAPVSMVTAHINGQKAANSDTLQTSPINLQTANRAHRLGELCHSQRKRLASNYLNSPLFLSARDSEDLCWKEELEHDDHCAMCKEEGNLQQCHSCTRAYHLDCLNPPLKSPPKGVWMCPKCQKKVLNKENLSWPHNFVQSYVTHKTVREEEKRRLMRRNSELKKECAHLKEEDQRLNKSLLKCRDMKERLLSQQRETQASLERLRALIRLIQRDHMIQVTMTATTTTSGGAALLSLPWIKPSSTSSTSSSTASPAGSSTLLHKSMLHSQGNN
ncbi:PHD finger protein 21B isoform X1 [Tachysurus ichikawai]